MVISGNLDKSNKVIVECTPADTSFIDNIIKSIYKDSSKYEGGTILGLRDRLLAAHIAEQVFDKFLIDEERMLIILVDVLGVYDNVFSLFLTYNNEAKLRLHGVVYN